jgi:hypothetical protein
LSKACAWSCTNAKTCGESFLSSARSLLPTVVMFRKSSCCQVLIPGEPCGARRAFYELGKLHQIAWDCFLLDWINFNKMLVSVCTLY